MQFNSGQELWEYYDKPCYYDPMSGLHFAGNTNIQDLIKREVLGNSPEHDSLIESARHYLTSVRVHDPIVNEIIDDGIYNHLSLLAPGYNMEQEVNDWNGFTEEQIQTVVAKYINLLDPLTLCWLDPQDNRVGYDREKQMYTFNANEPVNETDPTFCYPQDNPPDVNLYDCDIYHDIEQDILELLPEDLSNLYHEDFPYDEEQVNESQGRYAVILKYITNEKTSFIGPCITFFADSVKAAQRSAGYAKQRCDNGKWMQTGERQWKIEQVCGLDSNMIEQVILEKPECQ